MLSLTELVVLLDLRKLCVHLFERGENALCRMLQVVNDHVDEHFVHAQFVLK